MEKVIEKPKRIRIKKDVFKNAEFGKLYKTREGRKAVFLKFIHEGLINGCLLLVEGEFGFPQITVNLKGKHYSDKKWYDIVSEWES